MGTLSIVTCHSAAYYVILCILAFTLMWLWHITWLFTCLVKAEAIWNYADLLVIGLGVFDEVLASLQKQEPRGVFMGKLSHLEIGPLLNRNLGFQWDINLNILPTDVLICFFFIKMCERFQSILLVNSRAWHIYTRAANATGSSWLSSSAGSDLGSSWLQSFWSILNHKSCNLHVISSFAGISIPNQALNVVTNELKSTTTTQHPSTLNRLNKEKIWLFVLLFLGPSTLAHPADSCCAVGGCLFVGMKLSRWRFPCPKDGWRREVEVEAAWFQGLGAAVIAMNAVVMGGEIPSGLWMVSKKWKANCVYQFIMKCIHVQMTWDDFAVGFFSFLGWKDSVKWSK